MQSDRVASTLTTNSGVISSDIKGHPTQNRVLSLREIMILSSLQLCSANEKDVTWDRYGPKIGVDDSRINSESHQSENAENVQKPRHLILNRV